MTGSIKLRDNPGDMVRFACEKCGRAGQYSKQHLIWRFGPDIRLPDLLVKIANCEREGQMHNMCGVHYLVTLLLRQVAGLPMSAFGPKRTKLHFGPELFVR